jgi:hypothetical protein
MRFRVILHAFPHVNTSRSLQFRQGERLQGIDHAMVIAFTNIFQVVGRKKGAFLPPSRKASHTIALCKYRSHDRDLLMMQISEIGRWNLRPGISPVRMNLRIGFLVGLQIAAQAISSE